MSSSSSTKAFTAGAIASACAILAAQYAVEVRRKRQNNRHVSKSKTKAPSGAVSTPPIMDSPELDQRMIRKAEGVIQKRTSRITIVVERATNDHNYSAILRTAEALGVQNVWIIDPPTVSDGPHVTKTGITIKETSDEMFARTTHHLFAQRATEWLTVREFATTRACLEELRATNHVIWATDLSQQASCLTRQGLPILEETKTVVPEKLAIVFGTESVGCTQEMLEESDLRVYLPLRGFADSLNLSVATSLVVYQLFVLDPSIEGSMSESEQRVLRQSWYPKLAFQRLLTSAQKKQRARLQTQVKSLDELERRRDSLDANGQAKLTRLSPCRQELQELEAKYGRQAELAVQAFVDNPPKPLSDLRRADKHRVWFGGKNTRKANEAVWDGMPATSGYRTSETTASFFRDRVPEAATNDNEEIDESSEVTALNLN